MTVVETHLMRLDTSYSWWASRHLMETFNGNHNYVLSKMEKYGFYFAKKIVKETQLHQACLGNSCMQASSGSDGESKDAKQSEWEQHIEEDTHTEHRLHTDLSVKDVGGARATYKIQNKGSVLSAYRKKIIPKLKPWSSATQPQGGEKQKEQKQGNPRGAHTKAAASPTENWRQINCDMVTLQQAQKPQSTCCGTVLTLRGLST